MQNRQQQTAQFANFLTRRQCLGVQTVLHRMAHGFDHGLGGRVLVFSEGLQCVGGDRYAQAEIVTAASRMKLMKKPQANSAISIAGRAMPIDQLSSVISWNKRQSE